MQNIKHVVIACAGYGSRLGLDMPKCMVKLGGRTLLSYILEIVKDIEDIRIVVGFKEEMVEAEAKRINPNVVIVRNPDYRTTTNAYSCYLASKDLKEPFIIVDGDMIIDKLDFAKFLETIDGNASIVGICKSKTTDAVFVNLDGNGNVIEFQRERPQEYEWCGICYLKNIKIHIDGRYVFDEIIPHLPLPTFEFKCFEIDTPADLEIALANFYKLNY